MNLSNLIPGVAQLKAGLKFLPYIGVAALGIFALIQLTNARHWHKRYINSEETLAATIANYTGAQVAAKEINKFEVDRIELDRREIANGKDTEIRKSIDLAVVDAKRVRGEKTVGGVTSSSGTSENPTPSISVAGEGGMPIMDEEDVRICTVNTVKVMGWQDFYQEVQAAGQ
jgi:hypothetical protein